MNTLKNENQDILITECSGYLVTFLDSLGHKKEMVFLKERKYAAEEAAARFHGTCHSLYKL